MNESISSRVGRIISGSLNAIIDAVENATPETVMQESIREIDSAIADVRIELGKVIASKHMASNRLMSENQKHTELTEKIELAVNEGRDDLAEAAISSQLDIEAQIPILETTIADNATQEKELESYISALKAKKREMEQELDEFKRLQAEHQSSISENADRNLAVETKLDKATSTFDRVMKNATGVASRVARGDSDNAKKMAELDALAKKNRVQERLAEFKKSI